MISRVPSFFFPGPVSAQWVSGGGGCGWAISSWKQACPSRVEQSLRALHASLAPAKLWPTQLESGSLAHWLTLGQGRRSRRRQWSCLFCPPASAVQWRQTFTLIFTLFSFSSFLFHLTICMFVLVSVQLSVCSVWSHCVWHLKNAWQHLMLLLLSIFSFADKSLSKTQKRVNDFLVLQKKGEINCQV